MGRNLIVGDIHGHYSELMKLLEKAGFADSDTLYAVGDYTDRGKENIKVLRFLMEMKNFRGVAGNHDLFLQTWLLTGTDDWLWALRNGGQSTIDDFINSKVSMMECMEIAYWLKDLPALRIENKYIIVHGGVGKFSMAELFEAEKAERNIDGGGEYDDYLLWDRSYMLSALEKKEKMSVLRKESIIRPLDACGRMIFSGHTPTYNALPFISSEYHLVAIDTGAGHNMKLTLMDMDSLEYWQCDA